MIDRRVQNAIREMEESHEILIGWVQVFLLSLLGFLYFLSPKGFSGRVTIEPVPIVLGLYGPLIFVRLKLAYRKALTPAWLYASVIADTGLVTFLIWCFHWQYDQPIAFSLKAPTFIYYFLFLSLRCLRYEAKYVILSGVSAITAWMVLLLAGIFAGGEITHRYVDYILGARILIGAEVDKMVLLGMVTGVLAYSMERSRRLLTQAVQETQRRTQLTRFFSPVLADSILDNPQAFEPGRGVITQAAILSLDMRGFTKLTAQASPNEVLGILSEYHERMVDAIFANGGCVDKYMGDGILAHFGVATQSPRYAAEALSAIEGMITAADVWNSLRTEQGKATLRFGFACATGDVLFGAIGNTDKLELTVIGDCVNVASKLEKHTKKAGVVALTTRATYETAVAQGFQPRFPVEMLPGQSVDGISHPIDLVALATHATAKKAAA